MKRTILLSLTICLVFLFESIYGQALLPAGASSVKGIANVHQVVTAGDFKPLIKMQSRAAITARNKGEKPGAFQNVSFIYNDNVKVLEPSVRERVYSGFRDGIVGTSALGTFRPHPDSIYVDKETNLVMQFAPVTDKEMIVYRPPFTELFKDIHLPLQEVQLFQANTSYTAEKAEVKSSGQGNDYTVTMKFDSVTYMVEKGNSTFSVTLVGDISFVYPRLEGHYSKFGGYRLVFKAKESVNMRIYSNIDYSDEINIPIWGFEVEAGSLGTCEVGVFLSTTATGSLQLNIGIDQGIDFSAGVKGGTSFYIPTSINKVLEINRWCKVNYEIAGQMNVFSGIKCQGTMDFKGYKILDIYVTAGVEAVVKMDQPQYLDAQLGFRGKAGGKVISKKFTLLDEYILLYEKREKNFGGYKFNVLEACAYNNRIIGQIVRVENNKEGYQGPLSIYIIHPDGTQKILQAVCNKDGYFIAEQVSMKKGDKVRLGIQGVPNLSEPVEPTIPFREISVNIADYYNSFVEGNISMSSNDSYLIVKELVQPLALQVSTPGTRPHGIVTAASPGHNLNRQMLATDIISKISDFASKAVTYKGAAEIIIEKMPVDKEPESRTATSGAVSGGVPRQSIPAATSPARPQAASGQILPNIRTATSQISASFGFFKIDNLNLNPNDRVKIKINVNGFIAESPWVQPDGILISQITDEELKGSFGPGKESMSAKNSFVLVSPVRGEKSPTGSVRFLKGMDMKHTSVSNVSADKFGFTQLTRPVLWYDKTIDLQPFFESPGVSIAATGEWSAMVNYSSPSSQFSPWGRGVHLFEMVSFKFKQVDIGYRFYQETCGTCNSPAAVVNQINKSGTGSITMMSPVLKHMTTEVGPNIRVQQGQQMNPPRAR